MIRILKSLFAGKNQDGFIVIVSGLPRSGTSMMMQMLEAGGLDPVTDAVRDADDDNPRGYYELESAKNIERDSSWLSACKGKAVKMVSPLLKHLPSCFTYRILFMERDMKEVLRSQQVMLSRLGTTDQIDDSEMAERFSAHLEEVRRWLAGQKNISVLRVRYDQIVDQPLTNACAVNEFLGGKLIPEKMAQAVQKDLYRNKSETVPRQDHT